MSDRELDEDDVAMLHALERHVSAHRLDDFLAQGARCGWCAHPIRLRGYVLGGEERRVVFSSHAFPDNVVLKACGSRSELRCPSCAVLYRGDARHLVRAGLVGGKGVDESIAGHPAVFVTLTAPGFGVVHRVTSHGPCHVGERLDAVPTAGLSPVTPRTPATTAPSARRCVPAATTTPAPSCTMRTAPSCGGAPPSISLASWRRPSASHVLSAPRSSASSTPRWPSSSAADSCTSTPCCGPTVRTDQPPPIDAVVLARACQAAVRSVAVSHARGTARWGSEVDVQVLDTEARATQVAPYVAKYATKEPAMHPGLLSRILSDTDLKSRDLPPHLFNMVMSAWSLGNVPELRSLGLRRHAHHLGYSGHFLTKSQGLLDHLRRPA